MKVILSILMVVLLTHQMSPQEQTVFGNRALYEAVLDELFRTDSASFSDQDKVDEIVLRFSSSSVREFQLAIVERKAQPTTYRLWRVPDGHPSIWDQVAKLTSPLNINEPKRIADGIHLERATLTQPSEHLKQLTKQFSQLRFSPSYNAGLIIDAVDYDVWFYSLSNSTHFALQGSPHGERSDHPLILWMTNVRSEVEVSLKKDKVAER